MTRSAYRTKTGKEMGGKRWNARSVYDVLTDKKYIGKIEHMGIAYDGADSPTSSQASSNETLIAAIVKAWAWQEEFESAIMDGRFQSLEDFAKDKGVDRSYAGRLLRLTSLSPALTEQILDGDEPHAAAKVANLVN